MKPNRLILYALLALVIPGGGGRSAAQESKDADPKRQADRRALDQLTKDMIDAFDRRDAAAIAAHWTDTGEFRHNDDEPVRGRAEIRNGYERFFKSLDGKPKLEIQTDSLRFPSADTAVKETRLLLRNDDGEIVAAGRQDAVLVREGDQWKVAVIHESDTDVVPDVSLEELGWLVGTWRAVTKDREVTIVYEWDEKQNFIRGKFSVREGAAVVDSGTEIIGKDNARGVIRSWLFQSDGGFGSGAWSRDGGKWTIDVHNVKADGSELTATLLYIRVDPDTFTWQAVDLALDNSPLPDTPPIKASKRAPPK